MTLIVGGAEGAQALTGSMTGTDTATMTRMRHTMLPSGASTVTLHYAHWSQFESRQISGVPATLPLTVTATVEVVGAGVSSSARGTVTAAQTLTLNPGDTGTLTFTLPAAVDAGQFFYTNTYATASTSAGQTQIPRGSNLAGARGEGYEANSTDKTATGTVTDAGGLSTGYGPVRIDVTRSGNPIASLGVVGDSLNQERDSKNNYLVAAAATTWPRVTVAVGGDAMAQFKTSEGTKRRALIDPCDVIICAYGANDVSTTTASVVSTMIPDHLTGWTALAKGLTRPVWQATLTPRSTGIFTSSAQTPASQATAIAFWNAWLRDGAPIDATAKTYLATGTAGALRAGTYGHPLAGVIEVADAVETARNSSIWKAPSGVAYTPDGLHLTNPGSVAAAAAVDLTAIMPVEYPSLGPTPYRLIGGVLTQCEFRGSDGLPRTLTRIP